MDEAKAVKLLSDLGYVIHQRPSDRKPNTVYLLRSRDVHGNWFYRLRLTTPYRRMYAQKAEINVKKLKWEEN